MGWLFIILLGMLVLLLTEWPQFFVARWLVHEPPGLTPTPACPAVTLDWRTILGVSADETRLSVIKRCYRRQAQVLHPDRGGNTQAMARLNEAYRLALSELIPTGHHD